MWVLRFQSSLYSALFESGLEILTASQRTMSGFIAWGFDRSNFGLAGHVDQSNSIVMKIK